MTAVDIAARWREWVGPAVILGRVRPVEAAGVIAIAAVASLLRFVGLATRGTWDADQGHDLLVLRGLIRDGTIPLLGPPTSIGDFHHGVLYYYLLAPSAWLGSADPTVVVAEIAAAGVAAVIATWWLARLMGGALLAPAAASVAGLVAALLMAVSAVSIQESTFLWNPNVIALTSAITFVAAWQAWRTEQPRWWIPVAIGLALTMHSHVLGAVLVVPLAVLFGADVARRDEGRTAALRWGGASVVLVALTYVPLAIHELTHDFSESRAAVAFLRSGGAPVALDPVSRVAFSLVRVLAWPLTGLVTDNPLPGLAAALVVLGIVVWMLRVWMLRDRRRSAVEDTSHRVAAVRWLAGTLLGSIAILALGVSGLSTVTPLPTDHYHAFLDPLIFVAVGIGAAALWTRGPGGRLLAAAGVFALVGWNVAHWPPAVAPDGGWPAAQAAAQRIEKDLAGRPATLVGLPSFKPTDAYVFPLTQDGAAPVLPANARALIVLCDSLFVPDCGGPAESRLLAGAELGTESLPPEQNVGQMPLVDRFKPAPGRTISVFDVSGQ